MKLSRYHGKTAGSLIGLFLLTVLVTLSFTGSALSAQATVDLGTDQPTITGVEGSAITNYVITPFVGGVAQAATTVGNVTSATIVGLSNGTTYTFKVAAKNSVGMGPQSAASNAVTPQAPALVSSKCVVPNVIGKQLATAKTKVKKAHCRVETITYKLSTKAKKNHVLAETPRPGKRLESDAKVNLTVGRGGRR